MSPGLEAHFTGSSDQEKAKVAFLSIDKNY